LISSEIDSTYKSLKRYRQYDDTSKALLKFFKGYIRKPSRLLHLLDSLSKKLISINSQTSNQAKFKSFDYLYWVNEKIKEIELSRKPK